MEHKVFGNGTYCDGTSWINMGGGMPMNTVTTRKPRLSPFWRERLKAQLDSLVSNLLYDALKVIVIGSILVWIATKV